MPKRFIFILLISQGILTALHWLIYRVLISFFPQLLVHQAGLLVAVIACSFSFLIFSSLCHYSENFILRAGYVVSGVLLVFGLYFLLTSLIAVLIFFILQSQLQNLGFLALGAAILLTLYGIVNARIIRVIKIKITLPNLPAFWKNKVAVAASDLHFGHVLKKGSAKKIVSLINKQNPEIVFLPGDFYDGERTDFQGLADEFKKIKAPLGSYFSSGNHEMYAGYKLCEQAIKNAGIKILEDQKEVVEGLQIIGLAYKNETDESVAERLNTIGVSPAQPSVLLKHVPSHLQAVAKTGVNFQISGHTHLGQVWPFRYITKKVFKSFDYGLKVLGPMQIYTSSGVGTWGPPLRVFTKSEIIKITFE